MYLPAPASQGWLHSAVREVIWCDIAYVTPSSFWPSSSLGFLKSQRGKIQSEIVNITRRWGRLCLLSSRSAESLVNTVTSCQNVTKRVGPGGANVIARCKTSYLSYSSLSCGWAGRTCSGPAESGWLEGGPGRWSRGGHQCSPETHTGGQLLEHKICPPAPATTHLGRLKKVCKLQTQVRLNAPLCVHVS